MSTAAASNVVLVHGGFVDGSGWQDVYSILARHGHNVGVVQNPTLSLTGDVAATWRVIDQQPGAVVLAGYSYGGAVITEAPPSDGFLLLDRARFHASFAADVSAERAGSKVTEVAASHAVFLSQPSAVASLVEEAAAR